MVLYDCHCLAICILFCMHFVFNAFTVMQMLKQIHIICRLAIPMPFLLYCTVNIWWYYWLYYIGVRKDSGTGNMCTDILLQVSNVMKDIHISMLSDDNFSEVISACNVLWAWLITWMHFDGKTSFKNQLNLEFICLILGKD